jgi:hypothetical protein
MSTGKNIWFTIKTAGSRLFLIYVPVKVKDFSCVCKNHKKRIK